MNSFKSRRSPRHESRGRVSGLRVLTSGPSSREDHLLCPDLHTAVSAVTADGERRGRGRGAGRTCPLLAPSSRAASRLALRHLRTLTAPNPRLPARAGPPRLTCYTRVQGEGI